MNRVGSRVAPGPASDDRPMWDIVLGLYGYPAVLLAHKLKLFSVLGEQSQSRQQLSATLGIRARPMEALLSVCASLGLVEAEGDRYALSQLAKDYLLEESPTYFGGQLDLTIENASVWSLESLERAVYTDRPQIYGTGELFGSHDERAELARTFTRAMHSISVGPSSAWPEAIDLSAHRRMLDVGGGSGAHSIGAVLRWPQLHAMIFDLAPVCEVADEISESRGLGDRILTHVGDLWEDPFPAADLHFYSMIFHDWPADKCRFLTAKSFASLPPGGRIVVHEKLFNDDRTGPFSVAAWNVLMLLWCEGRQYSGAELVDMLRTAGFAEIETVRTWGDWSIVTGRKPGQLSG